MMRISDMLRAFANDLERTDNEALLLSETKGEAMDVVASALIEAAAILKEAAEKTEHVDHQSLTQEECAHFFETLARNSKFKNWTFNVSATKEDENGYCSESITAYLEDILEWVANLDEDFTCEISVNSAGESDSEEGESELEEELESLEAMATAFDSVNDPSLRKTASVLDQILLTIAAPKGELKRIRAEEDRRIEDLKKKYHGTHEELQEQIKAADALKAVEKSPKYKTYKPLEAPLDTRYCPDHPGAPVTRLADRVFQCSLDKKVYDFNVGFTTLNGNIVPPSGVADQTSASHVEPHAMFDTREQRSGNYYHGQ